MLLLMQYSIFLEGSVSLFPSVNSLSNLLLHAIRHVVYFSCGKVVIVCELVSHSSITMFIGWLHIRTRILSLKDCDYLVPNQRSVCNERVGERYESFRVTSKHRRPTEDLSTSNHLLILCEILDTISVVHGITCNGWMFQIIHQSITERLSIYSSKSSDVLFHRFQSLGPVLWINGGYQFWFLVSFLRVPLMIYCADLGYINIGVRSCTPNPLEMIDVINPSL